MISIKISIVLSDILKNYLIFQEVFSGKLSERAIKLCKLTELKFETLKLTIKFVFHG